MKKINLATLALIVLAFVLGFYFYPKLPEMIASHWGINGEVNGYSSKLLGSFLMPVISLALYLLFLFLPKIDPLKENIKKFRSYFETFIFLIILFLFYLYLLSIFWNLGYRFNFGSMLSPAFALLFYSAGVLIGKAKRNWFIGIRTPWTLSSDRVWNRTHELGGKLFKAIALISLLGIFFPQIAFYLVLAPVLAMTVYLFVFSYQEYKKIEKSQN
ncbi:MAG: DUF1648 domain-containing protein [Patescibacteria group bacterium]|nr:DUF1648 domain-containing protein [Patescibacteria group bacterium]